MGKKQILVNLVIIGVMTAIAFFCYSQGKATIVYVENITFESEGAFYPAFEAVNVSNSRSSSSIFLMEGDRDVLTIVGKSHELVIEDLDENDNVIQTYRIKFLSSELEGEVINIVPLVHGKLQGWNYKLD
ncbi:MAG TPA: hypothetical protein ENN89_03875 [Synergistetes bacterium]|nr:hypothetical protein [Synergistota bacterium]